MMWVYVIVTCAFGLVALAFLFRAPAFAVTLTAVCLFALAPIFQEEAGHPADADARLSIDPWRALAISPLADSSFLVSVLYQTGEIRTYRLALTSQEAKDRFLKAASALKKGRVLIGRAKRGRAGLMNDDAMDFDFTDAPETEPKERPAS